MSLSLGGGEDPNRALEKRRWRRSMRLRLVGPGWSGTGLTWGAGGCARPPRTISAAVVPLPHLGATGAGVPGPAPGAGGRRRRLRGRLVGRRDLGRGPGGRGVLGGGDALAGAGAGRLAACRDDGWRGEACASVSVAVDVSRETAGSGRGDRGSGRAEKAHPFFSSRRGEMPRRNARCRARRELRSIARTSALFALAIPGPVSVASARGLGALGRGLGRLGSGRRDGEGQSRGQRLASGRVAVEAFRRRSIACGSVAAPRKRARDGRCGRTHVLLLRPLLGHLLELFHCGVGRAG